jgi:hypothetical protein
MTAAILETRMSDQSVPEDTPMTMIFRRDGNLEADSP